MPSIYSAEPLTKIEAISGSESLSCSVDRLAFQALLDRPIDERVEGEPRGEAQLERRGIAAAASRRSSAPLLRLCTDWTERRAHLAGQLGTSLVSALERDGVVERRAGTRVVTLRGSIETWLTDI